MKTYAAEGVRYGPNTGRSSGGRLIIKKPDDGNLERSSDKKTYDFKSRDLCHCKSYDLYHSFEFVSKNKMNLKKFN